MAPKGMNRQTAKERKARAYGMNWGRRLRIKNQLPIDTPMVTPQPPEGAVRSVALQCEVNAFYDGVWTGYMEASDVAYP